MFTVDITYRYSLSIFPVGISPLLCHDRGQRYTLGPLSVDGNCPAKSHGTRNQWNKGRQRGSPSVRGPYLLE